MQDEGLPADPEAPLPERSELLAALQAAFAAEAVTPELLERFADPQDLFGLERGWSLGHRRNRGLAARSKRVASRKWAAGRKCVGSR